MERAVVGQFSLFLLAEGEVDFEQPFKQMIESFTKCRSRFAPLMECKSGSAMSVIHVFAHSHIDLACIIQEEKKDKK